MALTTLDLTNYGIHSSLFLNSIIKHCTHVLQSPGSRSSTSYSLSAFRRNPCHRLERFLSFFVGDCVCSLNPKSFRNLAARVIACARTLLGFIKPLGYGLVRIEVLLELVLALFGARYVEDNILCGFMGCLLLLNLRVGFVIEAYATQNLVSDVIRSQQANRPPFWAAASRFLWYIPAKIN